MRTRLTHVRGSQIGQDGAVHDDGAPGRDQERGKGLRHGHDAPEVDVEHLLALFDAGVQARHHVHGAGVVDQVVERPARFGLDRFHRRRDAGRRRDVEGEQRDVGEVCEGAHFGDAARGREDVQAALLEGFDQGRADAAGAAAGDEDGFARHGG